MNTEEINDVKPPIDLPFDWTLVWWALALVIVALIIFLVWYFLNKKIIPVLKPVIIQTSWEKALEALQALELKQYPKQGLFKEYFDGVSDIVRLYLEERFSIRAPEMTTEEFLISLQQTSVLTAPQQDILKQMMAQADLVKFAKQIPTLHECDVLMVTAKHLIEESRGV